MSTNRRIDRIERTVVVLVLGVAVSLAAAGIILPLFS